MSIEKYLLFVTVTSAYILIPGPSVLLAINNTINYGIKSSTIAVLGNVSAFQLLIVLSAVGLGSFLTASSELFIVLKILGGVYLAYMGIRMCFSTETVQNKKTIDSNQNFRFFILFRKAFLVTSTNPKTLVYVSVLLPQFINNQESLFPQVAIFGVTTAVIQFSLFIGYVVIACKFKNWFKNSTKLKLFNKFSGVTFIGFGVALGFS